VWVVSSYVEGRGHLRYQGSGTTGVTLNRSCQSAPNVSGLTT
jgi:hypothetical protein